MLRRTALLALTLTASVVACVHAQEEGDSGTRVVSGHCVLNPHPAAVLGLAMDVQGEQPVISRVRSGGPADEAGLLVGDVLLSIDGRDTRKGGTFRGATPGHRYVLRVKRGDEEKELFLVAAAPANAQAPAPSPNER